MRGGEPSEVDTCGLHSPLELNLARTQSASGTTSGKLEAQDWVNAASGLLAEEGVDAVRVEPLAKQLGVTKGSFYWHFRDRKALLAAILNQWRRHATLDIIDRLERSANPTARLSHLLRIPFHGERSDRGADVELSIRLWGRSDAGARSALQEVDMLRLKYIQGLLEEIGVQRSEAIPRSICAYSFMRVGGALIEHSDEVLIESCIAALTRR